MYISIETDSVCTLVVKNEWPDAIIFEKDVGEFLVSELADLLGTVPTLVEGVVVGGSPCQGFSALNVQRRGFGDPRSLGIQKFAQLVAKLRKAAPQIRWHAMLENVASMVELLSLIHI